MRGNSMADAGDRHRLVREQYRDASNLLARTALHARFGTNKYGWHRWVFDRFDLPTACRILEVGCGTGRLWAQNSARIPQGWEIALSDFSPGMLQEAWRSIQATDRSFRLVAADAQAIPFADLAFDAVIANHMLYHVPDITRGLSEICRVLKPTGRLYASTVGRNHLREIDELVGVAWPEALRWIQQPSEAFSLENGLDRLSRWFGEVRVHHYDEALVITESEPLVNYILSMIPKPALAGDGPARLNSSVEKELALRGVIHVAKDEGMFEASHVRG